MKRRFITGLTAAAFVFSAAPAAQAQEVAGTSESASEAPVVMVYSAMTDILSCNLYPTRPWCPNSAFAWRD